MLQRRRKEWNSDPADYCGLYDCDKEREYCPVVHFRIPGTCCPQLCYRDLAKEKEEDAEMERIGYKYEHTLKLEFPSDNKLLGRLLFALGMCRLKPEFRISYTVGNPEAVKNQLLGLAVKDATEKAGVLSSAAGLTLGDIQNMDYSWGRVEYEVQCMDKMLMCEAMPIESNSYDLDIEPDDIHTEDTVTVVWEIR